jgi:hypothetical protein
MQRRQKPRVARLVRAGQSILANRADTGHDAVMTAPTHATLATFRMDLSRETEQREGLQRVIVPNVRSSPGFVTGFWTLDRDASESTVMIVFDSEEHARGFAENVRANAPNQAAMGIELISIRLLEVTASA